MWGRGFCETPREGVPCPWGQMLQAEKKAFSPCSPIGRSEWTLTTLRQAGSEEWQIRELCGEQSIGKGLFS